MSEMVDNGVVANTMTGPTRADPSPRVRLLSVMPVTERRLDLAGIPTTILEGGDGRPVVLLHGPGEYAAKWIRVIPKLVKSCKVIVPDMPGHGESIVPEGRIEADHVFDWVKALIAKTCSAPPVLVGQILGGAIAARFASRHAELLSSLVLVDTLGLVRFQPAPEFGQALSDFLAEPNGQTHDCLWRHCAFDLERLRERMGTDWDLIRAYNLDRARDMTLHATQQSLMEQFGMPAILEAELNSIMVSTTLIWGRHDLATPLSVAQATSKRLGWPLHVIEDAADDPPIEQPEAFLSALDLALGGSLATHEGEGR